MNRGSSEGSILANRHGQFRYYNAQRCILEPSEAVCYPLVHSQISIMHCLSTKKNNNNTAHTALWGEHCMMNVSQ